MTNGCINRMSKEELRAKLSEFKLETRSLKLTSNLLLEAIDIL